MLNVSSSLQIILTFDFINCHLQGKVQRQNTSPIRRDGYLFLYLRVSRSVPLCYAHPSFRYEIRINIMCLWHILESVYIKYKRLCVLQRDFVCSVSTEGRSSR